MNPLRVRASSAPIVIPHNTSPSVLPRFAAGATWEAKGEDEVMSNRHRSYQNAGDCEPFEIRCDRYRSHRDCCTEASDNDLAPSLEHVSERYEDDHPIIRPIRVSVGM